MAITAPNMQGDRFDSVLNRDVMSATSNAYLELVVRVLFQPVSTADPRVEQRDGQPCFPRDAQAVSSAGPRDWAPIQDWQPGDNWTGWLQQTQRIVRACWNWKLTLMTPRGFPDLYWGPIRSSSDKTHQCNVECALSVVAVPSARERYHHIVEVVNPQPIASGVDPSFRSHAFVWDRYDNQYGSSVAGGVPIRHCTAAHEAGHLAGLPHIGLLVNIPGCSQSNSNAPICYGVGATL
jgi:hypothetical protein